MKVKKEFTVISMIIAVLVTTGCSSTPKTSIYNSSVPLEQSSTLRISEDCWVSEFNEKVVGKDWDTTATFFTSVEKRVIIPSGTHTLKIGYVYFSGSSRYTLTNTITNDFLPGHTYVVVGYRHTFKAGSRLFLFDETEIYNMCESFVPNQTSAEATQFEGVWVNTKDVKKRLSFADDLFLYTENDKNVIAMGFFRINGKTILMDLTFQKMKNGYWWFPADEEREGWKELEFDGTTITDVSGNILFPSIGAFKKTE